MACLEQDPFLVVHPPASEARGAVRRPQLRLSRAGEVGDVPVLSNPRDSSLA